MIASVSRRPRRYRRWVLRLLIVAGLVLLIGRQLNLQEFRAVVIAPRWSPLAVMVGVGLLYVLMGGLNIWIVLSAIAPIRFMRVLPYYLVASSVGTFTPAALGDFSLVGFLRREAVPTHQTLSAMLADRGVTLALNALVYVPLTASLVLSGQQLLWVPAVVGLGVATVLVLNLIAPVRRWLLQRLILRFLPQLEEFLRACSDLLRFHPTHLLANVGMTIIRSLVAGLIVVLALLAAGCWADLFDAVVLTNSLSLISSPGGAGVYEAGAAALFSQVGLPAARVLAAFVFIRVYRILFALLLLAGSRLVAHVPRAPVASQS